MGEQQRMITQAPPRRLLDAAKHGDVEGILAATSAGANLNCGDPSYGDYTATHLAAQNGHAVCLKWLVDAGANTDAQTKDDETPLHWACWKGHETCVRVLCDTANKDSRAKNGERPLHWAAEFGNTGCIQVLLDSGAQVDSKSNYGRTALHLAVLNNNVDCAKALIVHGASVEIVDSLVEATPLDLASTDEMRCFLEAPHDVMSGAILSHYQECRALRAELTAQESEIAESLRTKDDALRQAEECTDRMKVEIALRKNAEQFKEEVEARLDAERQARRICEKKLADVREELRKANEYIAQLEAQVAELTRQKEALEVALNECERKLAEALAALADERHAHGVTREKLKEVEKRLTQTIERLHLEQQARDAAERKLEETERRLVSTQQALDRTAHKLSDTQESLEQGQIMRENVEKALEEVQDKLSSELNAHDDTQGQLTRWHSLMHSFVGVVKTASPSASTNRIPYGQPPEALRSYAN